MKQYIVLVYDEAVTDVLLYCVSAESVKDAKDLVSSAYKQAWNVEQVPPLMVMKLTENAKAVQYLGRAEINRFPVPVRVNEYSHTPAVEWV